MKTAMMTQSSSSLLLLLLNDGGGSSTGRRRAERDRSIEVHIEMRRREADGAGVILAGSGAVVVTNT